MARGFKSSLRGYTAHLESGERDMLRSLFADVIRLLGGTVPSAQPGQPAPKETPGIGDTGPADTQRESPQLPEDSRSSQQRLDQDNDGDGTRGEVDGQSSASESQVDAEFWAMVGDMPETEDFRLNYDDPAIQRLFPNASHDEAQAEEFMDLTGEAIRYDKIDDLQRAIGLIHTGTLSLSLKEAEAFSRALNSVRLVLSSRLKITDEDSAARVHRLTDVADARDVDSYMALLYNFVSWLQDTLMTAMIGDL